jgi:hypothetical protein
MIRKIQMIPEIVFVAWGMDQGSFEGRIIPLSKILKYFFCVTCPFGCLYYFHSFLPSSGPSYPSSF